MEGKKDQYFRIYVAYSKKNGDINREAYQVWLSKEVKEHEDECGISNKYSILHFDVTRNSLFQMTKRELMKSIWLNSLKLFRIRTQFSDDEWVDML